MEVAKQRGKFMDGVEYTLKTKDEWYFEGYCVKGKIGKRKYRVVASFPDISTPVAIAEMKVDKKYGDADGFIKACNDLKKSIKERYKDIKKLKKKGDDIWK